MLPILRCIIFFLLLSLAVCATKTYYDILGIDRDAKLTDIKKAYRTLSLKHHPDRNKGNEEEATLKFREISEAYEVLSDESSRKQYDRSLHRGGGSAGATGGTYSFYTDSRSGRKPRDPFAQFDDLFKNDPFFKEAFQGMDDMFAKTFQNGGEASQENAGGGGLFGWIADSLGANIDIKVSSSTNIGGKRSSSSYSSSRGGGSYTSRSTRTIIQNGRRITVQSLEKDGNRIEEKYDGTTLIERKINGKAAGLIGDL
mmetsp:Transcript_36852/g.49352  ORF Transcript_36852/g.49352 Transcript_36852/m.49352 type:complete len:256 (-) Transcript_36852:2057-2824(-)